MQLSRHSNRDKPTNIWKLGSNVRTAIIASVNRNHRSFPIRLSDHKVIFFHFYFIFSIISRHFIDSNYCIFYLLHIHLFLVSDWLIDFIRPSLDFWSSFVVQYNVFVCMSAVRAQLIVLDFFPNHVEEKNLENSNRVHKKTKQQNRERNNHKTNAIWLLWKIRTLAGSGGKVNIGIFMQAQLRSVFCTY